MYKTRHSFRVFYLYDMEEPEKKKNPDYYIGIGLCFGVVFGSVFDNIGIGIAIGLAIGVAMQQSQKKKS